MRQLTFPSDITWQKSMCLTASLNSSTITSTMQEVSEGQCWAGKLLFYHAARWLFWMKEGSQTLCPYNEIIFSSTYPGTCMAGKLPSRASCQLYFFVLVILLRVTMIITDVVLSYYEETFHSWELVAGVSPLPDQATCLNYTAGLSCTGGDISLGLDLTWPGSIARYGSYQRTPSLQSGSAKGNPGPQKYPATERCHLEWHQT